MVGAYVTPQKSISMAFGKEKPGDKHYMHIFEAEIADYPRVEMADGRLRLDLNAGRVGELEIAPTPDNEGWENYQTLVELTPLEIIEY